MRKLFSIFTIFTMMSLLSSCDGNLKDPINTVFTDFDTKLLEQEIFADETETKGTFTFTASEDWSVSIDGATKSNSWVDVSPMNGNAGKSEINITIDVNATGKDRKEKINIIAGESIVTITISQKSVTAEGEKPSPDPEMQIIKSFEIQFTDEWGAIIDGEIMSASLEYDNQNRLQKMQVKDTWIDEGIKKEETINYNYSYSDAHIVETIKHIDGNTTITYTLDNKGRVVSSEGILVVPPMPDEKISSTLTYNSDGYIEHRDGDINFYWTGGNLTKIDSEKDLSSNSLSCEMKYSDHKNKTNLDLNIILIQTEMASIAYSNLGVASIRKIGKSSSNLISEELGTYIEGDYTNEYKSRYVYEFNAEGLPIKITVYDSTIKPEPNDEIIYAIFTIQY